MQCVWCHDTNECAMGDEDGFFFGSCKSYSYKNDNKCQGKISSSAITIVRIVVGIFVAIMIVLGITICYKQVKSSEV